MINKELNWVKFIRNSAKKRILYSYHALNQMNLEERLITTNEVKDVILKGKIIESRLKDSRGATFLLSGKTEAGRFVHVVCSPKEEFLVVVTAYIPVATEWTNNFSKRIKS